MQSRARSVVLSVRFSRRAASGVHDKSLGTGTRKSRRKSCWSAWSDAAARRTPRSGQPCHAQNARGQHCGAPPRRRAQPPGLRTGFTVTDDRRVVSIAKSQARAHASTSPWRRRCACRQSARKRPCQRREPALRPIRRIAKSMVKSIQPSAKTGGIASSRSREDRAAIQSRIVRVLALDAAFSNTARRRRRDSPQDRNLGRRPRSAVVDACRRRAPHHNSRPSTASCLSSPTAWCNSGSERQS